jgi:hypothetical protein
MQMATINSGNIILKQLRTLEYKNKQHIQESNQHFEKGNGTE